MKMSKKKEIASYVLAGATGGLGTICIGGLMWFGKMYPYKNKIARAVDLTIGALSAIIGVYTLGTKSYDMMLEASSLELEEFLEDLNSSKCNEKEDEA